MAGNLTRFDPFDEVMRFDPFRNSIINDFFRDSSLFSGLRGADAGQRIRVDVSETDQNYQVNAEIPGVKKEDIRVAVEGNRVSLTVAVREEREESNVNMLYRERSCGQRSRTFTLPQEVNDKDAQARFEDGVLQLTLPKKAGTGGRQLTIR